MITKALNLTNRVINQQASGIDYAVFIAGLIFISVTTAAIALFFSGHINK